jgi:hypothetical protein
MRPSFNENKVSSRSPWHDQAPALARWAWDRYFVRDDVWGGYTALNVRGKKAKRSDGKEYVIGKTITCPSPRKRGLVKLSLAVLERHFRATRPEEVIGAHTTSLANYSKFGTVEVDYHSENSNAPEINWRASLGWYRQLTERGLRPLLWDSNGAGGYHLDTLMAEPIPTPRLFWFLRDLVSNHAAYGLPSPPETFPKQSSLRPKPDGRGKYGNWVRLPGLHHTRPAVWARMWDGSRWLEGKQAAEYLLTFQGDALDLIPEHDEQAHRIRAYLAKVPHGSEGTGRDDRAFNAAAFLIRDMGLSDADALVWLEEWDAGNSPPKGRERLQEIIANAHEYGRNSYGSGLQSPTPPGASPPEAPAAPETPRLALDIILEDFRRRYQPRFRRGNAIYSDSLSREVKPAEACFAADKSLLARLAGASDAPLDKHGVPEATALPRFFWTWSKSAWAELLKDLRDEGDSDEISASAEEAFRERVAACLHAQAVFGNVIDKQGTTEQQRRTLLQWCQLWAKPGGWQQVRSALLWCRKEANGQLSVALRSGLFGQFGPRPLAELSQTGFARLAEQYRVGRAQRACGQRVVVLTADFLAELQVIPSEEPDS